VQEAGWCVLPGLVPAALLEALRRRFGELLAAQQAAPTNRGPARYQMYLPWEPPFSDPGLWAAPRALAVVRAVFAEEPALVYLASDTPLPGSDFQRVHADTRVLFPETALAPPAYGLVLNVPLVDCSEANGSLEFWPGTHLTPPPPDVETAAAGLPSRRANLAAGDGLLRDLRMWHRGTPNRSTAPRPHLALVYVRPWYRFEQQQPAIPPAALSGLTEAQRHLLRCCPPMG